MRVGNGCAEGLRREASVNRIPVAIPVARHWKEPRLDHGERGMVGDMGLYGGSAGKGV